MPKNIDILIDPDTGDLQIDTRKNNQGIYAQGLQIGEVTVQNQATILQKENRRSTRPSVSVLRISSMITKLPDGPVKSSNN